MEEIKRSSINVQNIMTSLGNIQKSNIDPDQVTFKNICTYMCMCVCVCVYIHVTIINDKRGPEFEGKKGDIYERLWRKGRGKCSNYIIVSRIKEIILQGK